MVGAGFGVRTILVCVTRRYLMKVILEIIERTQSGGFDFTEEEGSSG